jgi:mRNA interferase YafQ
MAFEFVIDGYFAKKYKKLTTKNPLLKSKIKQTLDTLFEDPRSPTLKSHKVITPKFGMVYSSSVTGDIRIIWRYGVEQIIEVIELIDIGGHNDVY